MPDFSKNDPFMEKAALITDPLGVLAVLLGVLALLFAANGHPSCKKIFKIIPLLVFAYFAPTSLSNTFIIPLSSPVYTYIKKWLLPASLLLLTLSVDLKGILGLGKKAILMFLAGTLGIVLGGPLAVCGYVLGTYAGLVCAFLLQLVHGIIH